MYDIFLSYSSNDRDRLAQLVDVFQQQGWRVFWDHQSVPVGKTYAQYIEDGLRDSTCVVVAWSENSVKSEWVREEANKAKKRGVMLPIRLDKNDPPFGFSEYQAADFSQWQGDPQAPVFKALADGILGHVNAARAIAERQAKQDELAQLQARLETEQKRLQDEQHRLSEQRELLDLRAQAAKQKEQERQTAWDKERTDLLAQQAELQQQLADRQQELGALGAQIVVDPNPQLAAELATAQQQCTDLQAQLTAIQSKLQQAEAAQRAALAAQQQSETKLRTAEQAQQQAEEKHRSADEARQTAENQLRSAQQAQAIAEQTSKQQHHELSLLNQQLIEQRHEFTVLRQQAPKVVEKIVFKPVGSLKGTLLGALGGMVLAALVAGAMWPKAVEIPVPAQNTAQQPIAPAEPAAPSAAEQEQQRLAAIAAAKKALDGNDPDAKKQAVQQLLQLTPLDGEAMRYLGLAYETGVGIAQNAKKACHWYQQAVQAGDSEAQTYLTDLKKSKQCK